MKDNNHPGAFIVVEGHDGAGTTTQAKKLADYLDGYYTFEPTDYETGDKVQSLISKEDSDPLEVAEAFSEDRENHLRDEIIPRLENGEVVVSDRYYHSSLTYQPVMGADFEKVKELNTDYLKPDITFILEAGARIGFERIESRGKDDHIFEDVSFQKKVIHRYRELDEKLDENIVFVDAGYSIEKVQERLREFLDRS